MIFNGIITSILDEKRIVVQVDAKDIHSVTNKLSIKSHQTKIHDFINVNIKSAQFDIKDFEWNSPVDLIGLKLNFDCIIRPYDFRKSFLQFNEITGREKKIYTRCSGVTVYAKQIKNY